MSRFGGAIRCRWASKINPLNRDLYSQESASPHCLHISRRRTTRGFSPYPCALTKLRPLAILQPGLCLHAPHSNYLQPKSPPPRAVRPPTYTLYELTHSYISPLFATSPHIVVQICPSRETPCAALPFNAYTKARLRHLPIQPSPRLSPAVSEK